MKRIGIAGAAGSGKTTAASYLAKEHGFTLLGFATPLYKLGDIHSQNPEEWHSRLFGWTWDYLEPMGYSSQDMMKFVEQSWDAMNDIPVVEGKNRTLLQTLGTEVGRNLDENLWTSIFESKVKELGDAKIVNDNLRFPNEFECLNRLDFTTVYLEVPDEMRSKRYEKEYGMPMDQSQLSHASEAHLKETMNKCDYIYDNIGHIDQLQTFLSRLIEDRDRSLQVQPVKLESIDWRNFE